MQQMVLNMMFNHPIDRFDGARRGRQDEKQCQQLVHEPLKESLLLRKSTRPVFREITLATNLKIKIKSRSLVSAFPPEYSGFINGGSVLFVALIGGCVHHSGWVALLTAL